MQIRSVRSLPLDGVKVIEFARAADDRGYFSETWRQSDLAGRDDVGELAAARFVQINESFSRAGVLRGMHFQWDPDVGKLVRPIEGHLIDLVLDIRPGSPTLGKAVMCDLQAPRDAASNAWIWIPPGFAHGVYFPADTRIEYFCTGEYRPGHEGCVVPFGDDVDWSLCDPRLHAVVRGAWADGRALQSDRDKAAGTLTEWLGRPEAQRFAYTVPPRP